MSLLHRIIESIKPLNGEYLAHASERLDNLTKPKGSLGSLEEYAKRVVAITENKRPVLDKKAVFVMASDHGVAEERISAYPREVTKEMVLNFLRGGAGINVLARQAGVDVIVVDMGVDWYFGRTDGLITRKISNGTKNLAKETAMTPGEAIRSVEVGIVLAKEAVDKGYKLLAVGDMGIGNTTSAAAVICALTGLDPIDVVGYGTGISSQTWEHKVEVVKDALALHDCDPEFPVDVLARVGGFEIGGITGVILAAASMRVPVVVDGFVSTAGASIAIKLCPEVKDYIFFSHKSAEGGHGLVLERLGVEPILDLNMRLGEGTGAVLGMFIIEAGVRAYNEMATFEEAEVSRKS